MNMDHIAVIDQNYPDVISVSWDTSSVCNYRCSYCDPKFNSGKNLFPELHLVERFMTDLAAVSKKKLFFEMKGGEPTLWRQMDDFLSLCNDRNWGVGLVTNVTKPLSWWENKLPLIGQVCMSLHPESYKLDELIEKMDYINRHLRAGAMYMLYPPLFEQSVKDIEKMLEKIPNLYLRVSVLSIPGSENKLYDYTPEMQEFISKINNRQPGLFERAYPEFPFFDTYEAKTLNTQNQAQKLDAQELKLKNKNQWVGWKCHAGLDRIHISLNGTIFRGQCEQGGAIGNLHTGVWSLPTQPTTCSKERCFCGGEILLKKWNPKLVSLT